MGQTGGLSGEPKQGKKCVTITFIICATMVCLAMVVGGTWVTLKLIEVAPW